MIRRLQVFTAPDEYIRVVDAMVAPIAKEKEKMLMPEILHITTQPSWDEAVAQGEYRGDTLATEGFIHCSTAEQLAWVVEKFYKGRTGMVVLRIDPEKLKPALKWENPQDSSNPFPHVYGPINSDAVVEVVPLEDLLVGEMGVNRYRQHERDGW